MEQLLSIIRIASARSIWRGLDYCESGHVRSLADCGDGAFDALVDGSGEEPYRVHVDTRHTTKSTCTCPFVQGNRKICKHMIATVFAAMPEQIKTFHHVVEQEEQAIREAEEQRLQDLWRKVCSLKKSELQERYFDALLEIESLRHGSWW